VSTHRRLQGLQALAEGSTNQHEAEFARQRADELIAAHPEAATPQTWADLTSQQRAELIDRLAAQVQRSLIRNGLRNGYLTQEQAEHDLRQYAQLPPLTDAERILFQTQDAQAPFSEIRRLVRDEVSLMEEDTGYIAYKALAERVCAKLAQRDHQRARRIIAGMFGALARQCGTGRSRRRA